MYFNKSLFPKTFILSLSGGTDSIAAAHFLKSKNFKFSAIHINQNFIPQDSLAARRVKDFCQKFQIDLEIIEVNDQYITGSKEDFCRNIRYRELEKHTRGFVLVCQHLNDCAESYFLNFLRGHPEYCPIPFICERKNITIFRPFLLTKKEDFIKYIEENELENFVTHDELNNDLTLLRNWTRKVMLPEIKKKYLGLEKVTYKIQKRFIDRDKILLK